MPSNLQHGEESNPLTELKVPPEFARYDDTTDSETIVQLEQWKGRAYEVLSRMREHPHSRESLDVRGQAEAIYHTAAFDGEGPWVLKSSQEVVKDILSTYDPPSIDVLESVLRDIVKPIFRPNPHPLLNVETGRKLPRATGGPLGHLDYLEGQEWKAHPEISNVLSWCISHADMRVVEKLWHLFIPPIMTFLDDHQAGYKLQGIQLVSKLLATTPPEVLRHTGIDSLLLNSLNTCLTFLHNPETPALIRAAVPTGVRLIELTTAESSSVRFEQLCSLLGDGIIGNIWIYATKDPDALQASVDVIPDVVQPLGVGAARYLKALIPQLVFPLVPAPENGASTDYKLSSLRALSAIMQACAPRIHRWRGAILEAVLKCWVDLVDKGPNHEEYAKLRDQLSSVCALLSDVCQPIATLDAEYRRVVALDPAVFGPLLQSSILEASA